MQMSKQENDISKPSKSQVQKQQQSYNLATLTKPFHFLGEKYIGNYRKSASDN